jgi:hypothetical protein
VSHATILPHPVLRLKARVFTIPDAENNCHEPEIRQFNLALWNRMLPADVQRTGQHNERGPESLGVMLRMLAGHDLSHRDQLTQYVQAIRQPE